jgi:hypothetical protein
VTYLNGAELWTFKITMSANTPPKSKAFNLRLLRQAVEKGPEELQLIFEEVLNLPKRKQEELVELLPARAGARLRLSLPAQRSRAARDQ